MSDPIHIPLDDDDTDYLVEPPIVDLLYFEPTDNSYIVTFVPEQAVSPKRPEGGRIQDTSADGRRIAAWLDQLGILLGLGAAIHKIVHRGDGDFGLSTSTGSVRALSSPELTVGTAQHVYVALQDIAQTAQIAFLSARLPQSHVNTLRPRVLRAETRDGRLLRGAAEGNNASWMCACGYTVPLLGTTRPAAGDTPCPKCGRVYRVYPFPHSGEKVDAVKEIEPNKASA